ncbi:hypothetical protein H4217_007583 [Coemansia sp. RSA 1939]|nr:hypothetical protein H4217_007583 [Coemansia sp. RSA 1939]KAJ2614283.1 hypothetical protein EV177_002143 [Coemansia sp. RSA 1804]
MAQAVEQRRIYLGGFTQPVSEDELRGRFKPFGQVDSVEIPQTASNGAATRGFAYITLKITAAQWHRCLSVYSGAKWKGGKLRVEEAKENYMVRLRREIEENKEARAAGGGAEECVGDKRPRCFVPDSELDTECIRGTMARDMSLVTTKNIDRYEGWARGRYNRPVLKLALVKPDGNPFMYEPLRYKNGFEKLFGSVRPKNWEDLLWEYDEEAAKADFSAARKASEKLAALAEASHQRVAKKLDSRVDGKHDKQTDCLASRRGDKKLRDSGSAECESDDDADMLDQLQMKRGRETQQLAKETAGDVPFEDAEDIASLVANTGQQAIAPELQAKLASGAFDSDSEDESMGSDSNGLGDGPPSKRQKMGQDAVSPGVISTDRMSAEELLNAKRERQRTSAILEQLLQDTDIGGADGGADSHEKGPATDGTIAFESDSKINENLEPCDGSSSDRRKSSSAKDKPIKKTKESNSSSSNSSSSDSSDDSEDSLISGSGPGSSDKDEDGMSEKSSDSDSDSDSGSDSDSDSDKSSDSDSDDDKDDEDGAMDVDVHTTKASYSELFGEDESSKQESQNPQAPKSSSGMFGGATSSGFRFTEILGLEADEPSAMSTMAAREMVDHPVVNAPVTGGVRLTGPPERNLNANRLPAFFPDTDSPAFKRPEPLFQRQKNIEELEKDLEDDRAELTKDYKAQHRSAVRRSQKMRQKRN